MNSMLSVFLIVETNNSLDIHMIKHEGLIHVEYQDLCEHPGAI